MAFAGQGFKSWVKKNSLGKNFLSERGCEMGWSFFLFNQMLSNIRALVFVVESNPHVSSFFLEKSGFGSHDVCKG